VGVLLLAAAANAQDTVIQTSLLGRVESKRIAAGSPIFVKVVTDWKQGRCRLRDGDTLEGRVVAIEHRTPASKREQMTVRFLPLTCAGDESRVIVPILVAIQSKPHTSDTSMLDRAYLMTAFSKMVGAEGRGGAATSPGQQDAAGRALTASSMAPPPLHTGDVRGFPGTTLKLPNLTMDPTAILSTHEMLFDPEAQFFLVVRTVASHPAVNIASAPALPSATGQSSIPARLQEPVAVETCVESGCKLADVPALQTGGQLERRLSLRSLGYKPRGNHVMRSLGEDAAISFLGENQMLITFNAHALIERSATDKAWDTAPRVIRALVVSAHDGKVLHAEDWRVKQDGQYLWPLEGGRVLVAMGDTLTIFGPGLRQERQWALPGPLAILKVSPSRRLIVAAVVHERHIPEEHRRLAEFMGPGRPVAEDYALSILDGQLNVVGTKQLNATPDIPAVLDSGLLVSDPKPRSQWKVSELRWNGQQHTVAEVHSPCPLRISSLPTNLILLTGCSADGMHSWYRVVRRDGKSLLNGNTKSNGWLENAVALTAKQMFAIGIVEAGRRVDFEEGMYASEFQKISISVYSSTNGQRLYATQSLLGSPDRQSFALNEDGDRLAVLSDGEISLYKTKMRLSNGAPAHPGP
jgi:hypothetical protein